MKLAIIVGATRPGRKTLQQARWVVKSAEKLDSVKAELVDLKDYPMPFFDEPISPRYNPNRKIDPAVQPWLKKLEEFDAYIFVTAEYNHSIPAVLKNALDYVTFEIQRKPVAVVSHGTAGGARAATDLKEILSESQAAPIPKSVATTSMSDLIDEEGELTEQGKNSPFLQLGLNGLFAELTWYSNALSVARGADK